jgi:hypothetical protein
MPSWIDDWRSLPRRSALLLGLGALSVAGAGADAVGEAGADGDAARVPQQSAKHFGDLLIWSDAGRIFVSEGSNPAEELALGNSAEAAALRELLGRDGATAARPYVLRDRIILVGGGGSGFSWQPSRQPDSASPTPAPTTGASPGGDATQAPAATVGSSSSATATVAPKK